VSIFVWNPRNTNIKFIYLFIRLKSWADDRKQALIPSQLSGLFKGGIKVDRTVS